MTQKRYYPLLASIVAHVALPIVFGGFLVETSRFALASGTQQAGTQTARTVSVHLVRHEHRAPVAEAPPMLPKTQPPLPDLEKRLPKPKIAKKQNVAQRKAALTPALPVELKADPAAATSQNTVPANNASASSVLRSENGAESTTTAIPDYLRNPPPPYPRESRLAGEQGMVLLAVSLDAYGAVQSLAIEQSSGFPRLDTAALHAVKLWKFRPAKVAGVSISSSIQVPVKFVLRSSESNRLG